MSCTIAFLYFVDQIVNFSAYSVQDIVAILNEKFNDFEKSAIEYCARKVAAVDGDLRKALDICRYKTFLSVTV